MLRVLYPPPPVFFCLEWVSFVHFTASGNCAYVRYILCIHNVIGCCSRRIYTYCILTLQKKKGKKEKKGKPSG